MEPTEFWNYFWFYFPLGIIGIWRWSVWLFKKICAWRYKPFENNDGNSPQKEVSIIVPVYNEDPEIFKNALSSWEKNEPSEIIAVIDHSDKECIRVFQEFAKNNPRAKLIITMKPGKRPALADGIKEAKSEIVALVDSDTVWNKDVKKNALLPFKNPEIGGVVTRQNSLECKGILQKITDIFWDIRNADEWPSLTAMGKSLTCLSGRTAFYRREIILPKLDEFLNEIIFGRKKESGEDKCLTRLVQRDGWKTFYQSNAQVYTSTPSDFKTFAKQRIRWTRNSFNSDLVSLFIERWAWKHPYLAFYMLDRFVSPFTLLLAPIYFGISLALHHWIISILIMCWWILSRGIKIIPHLKRRSKDIYVLPVYTFVNFLIAIFKIYALMSLRKQKWIREKEERKTDKGLISKLKESLIPTICTGGIICLLVIAAIH